MSPPHRQSVARISEELGIHVITLYKWRKAWRLQGEVVPASEKDPELECHRQVHGGAGDRWPQCHRAQRLLPGAWPVPRAGGTLAPSIPGCQRQASAHLVDAVRRACRAVRAEGAGEAPRPGPA